jgi:hypothetical protein
MHAFLATLSPSQVPRTSWPARSRFLSCLHSSYSKMSGIQHNFSRRLCSRFRHQNMQVLHLPCLWSPLLLGRPRRNEDASTHSTRLCSCICWLISRSSPRYSYHHSPDTTSANPTAVCTATTYTLEGNQAIQDVIEAFMSARFSDFLNKGNRFLPRP